MRIVKGHRAQTALELAVFGAILIFILGVIVKSSISRSFQQHSMLRATRWAMTQSYTTSAGMNNASRNSASILVIEDRLTVGSGKYGAIDRTPFIVQGSGTHSANLFMPIDFPSNPARYLDYEDLRRMDVFVNGIHFDFTTEAFSRVELAVSCAGASCAAHPECDGDCTTGSREFYPGADISPAQWEPDCADVTDTQTINVDCALASPCPSSPLGLCSAGCAAGAPGTYPQTVTTTVRVGCAKLYTIVDNHPVFKGSGPAGKNQWCDDGMGASAKSCPRSCYPPDPLANKEPGCNLSAAERFDLDRVGGSDVLPTDREYFAWQWRLVLGFDEAWRPPLVFNAGGGALPSTLSATLHMAEGIILEDADCAQKCQKSKNISFDVDGDLKLEYMMQNTEHNRGVKKVAKGGVILSLGMRDNNLADMDLNFNTSDELAGKRSPGFTKDLILYSFVHDAGTYFQIDEGKLFSVSGGGDTRQFIRTASKKDQIDYIERIFQLSNNTGRFCNRGDGPDPSPRAPVEACGYSPGECFNSANIEKICMDISTDPATGRSRNVILIRSRVEDLHGRKWVTDVSGDPYVNFNR